MREIEKGAARGVVSKEEVDPIIQKVGEKHELTKEEQAKLREWMGAPPRVPGKEGEEPNPDPKDPLPDPNTGQPPFDPAAVDPDLQQILDQLNNKDLDNIAKAPGAGKKKGDGGGEKDKKQQQQPPGGGSGGSGGQYQKNQAKLEKVEMPKLAEAREFKPPEFRPEKFEYLDSIAAASKGPDDNAERRASIIDESIKSINEISKLRAQRYQAIFEGFFGGNNPQGTTPTPPGTRENLQQLNSAFATKGRQQRNNPLAEAANMGNDVKW